MQDQFGHALHKSNVGVASVFALINKYLFR